MDFDTNINVVFLLFMERVDNSDTHTHTHTQTHMQRERDVIYRTDPPFLEELIINLDSTSQRVPCCTKTSEFILFVSCTHILIITNLHTSYAHLRTHTHTHAHTHTHTHRQTDQRMVRSFATNTLLEKKAGRQSLP